MRPPATGRSIVRSTRAPWASALMSETRSGNARPGSAAVASLELLPGLGAYARTTGARRGDRHDSLAGRLRHARPVAGTDVTEHQPLRPCHPGHAVLGRAANGQPAGTLAMLLGPCLSVGRHFDSVPG